MSLWIYFWGIVVLFSLASFSYMSVKILILAVAELKTMFRTLEQGQNK